MGDEGRDCGGRSDGRRRRGAADVAGASARGLEPQSGEGEGAGREGATVAATPAPLAGEAEVVITLLSDAAAIDSVYRGPEGLLSGKCAGKLFIEMSTVRPEVERFLPLESIGKLGCRYAHRGAQQRQPLKSE